MLKADNLTVTTAGRDLLRAVHCSIAPGELTAILGENGAGKSTLLRTLASEIQPGIGRVELDGVPLSQLSPIEIARRRAVMPQSSSLEFPFLAEEVVAMGRHPHHATASRREHNDAIERALSAAGVDSLRRRIYPTLSGGEQQRVQFARVLAQIDAPRSNHNRYLLLDEPASNLDLRRQHEMMRVLHGIARSGVGVLIILHDLNLASWYSDRMVVMKAGEVLIDAPPAEAMRVEAIERAFGHPAVISTHPNRGRPMMIPEVMLDGRANAEKQTNSISFSEPTTINQGERRYV
ncbi:MAG: heme ABC transporter ATP-binding protein [bacterium]|nr:heme ABC transporter ATP-binding protein [bacterium]